MIRDRAEGVASTEIIFKALADPHRRKILEILRSGSRTAGEIAAEFEITKGSLSHHFNVLKEAGLIRCERRAQHMVYWIDATVFGDVSAMLRELFRRPRERTRSR